MGFKILFGIVFAAFAYFALAFGLIVSQRPTSLEPTESLDFSRVLASPFLAPDDPAFGYKSFRAADGAELVYTHVAARDASQLPLVVMLHGSGWHGRQFDSLAWRLRDVAEVKALTLRGHGLKPRPRGDVAYIGQLEDDIAALIAEEPETREIVLLGHSSGGGLAVRFAGGAHGGLIDSAILLAPFLQYDAPVTRPGSGGWTRVLTRRVIGLAMLNAVGIHRFDGLTMLQLNMPREVLMGAQGKYATLRYSWRLNQSYAPRRDYLADVAALPPFLLVAGAEDEAFIAEGYEPLMREATEKGTYALVGGVGHLDVVGSRETEALIREHLRGRGSTR